MPPFGGIADALEWLDAHVDFESTMPSRRSLPTLARMAELVGLLGNPEQAAPAIHVTGTNGKGSTVAMATALLMARGLHVGTYTSPNLDRVNERIAVDGEPIDDAELLDLLERLALVEPLMGDRPTRFELLTAAAFLAFSDRAVDVAVVEVGLGGRWDSTNVVRGDVAVVTNVSYDHTDVLGPTLADIARDKSGIFKDAAVGVVGITDAGLADLVAGAAHEAGADPVVLRGIDFDCVENVPAVGGRLVTIRTPRALYPGVYVPLHGAHQGENAACALTAVEAFFDAELDPEVVAEGFATTRIGGRIEVIGHRPLVIVDGAHNVAGMAALAETLREEFSVGGRLIGVVGMLRGRDPSAMFEALDPAGIARVVVCEPDSPRAMPADVVAEAARGVGLEVSVVPDVAGAVTSAMAEATADDGVVVCGSLYVATDARRTLTGPPVEGSGRDRGAAGLG